METHLSSRQSSSIRIGRTQSIFEEYVPVLILSYSILAISIIM